MAGGGAAHPHDDRAVSTAVCVRVSQQRLPEPFSGDGFGLWRLGADAKGGMLVIALVEVTWVTCTHVTPKHCRVVACGQRQTVGD